MDTNLENILVRKSSSYNAVHIGFDLGEERYIAKAQGLVGFEIFAEDKIFLLSVQIITLSNSLDIFALL